MRRRVQFFFVIASVLLMAMSAAGQTETVMVSSPQALSEALVGSAVNLGPDISPARRTIAGGEVVWKQIRESVDDAGRRHVFARQYLRLPSGDVEIFGSEIGVHYGVDGKLKAAGGAQFRTFHVANTMRIGRDAVHERAVEQLNSGLTVSAMPYTVVPKVERIARDKSAMLLAIPSDGGDLRLAYQVTVGDQHGRPMTAVIDADSASIISTSDNLQYGNCGPSYPISQAGAFGWPQRGDIPHPGYQQYLGRGLVANATSDRGARFPYEAYMPGTPEVLIFQEIAGGTNPGFRCNDIYEPDYFPGYTLFPVIADEQYPWYGRFEDTPYDPMNPSLGYWHGSAAADAMYKTLLTISAFSSLGRHGWDGYWGRFQVVIDSSIIGCPDSCAAFGSLAPSYINPGGGTVYISPPAHNSSLLYASASLDQIGHEWGHGVINTTAGFPTGYYHPVGDQLSEGFADVIGQLVEKIIEPAGAGVETSSDWDLAEDVSPSGQYAFSGTRDDGDVGHYYGLYHFDNKLHRYDGPDPASNHDRSNMLNVVYYLLSQGGPNPICGRMNNCSITVPAGLGPQAAGQLLFDTLRFYLPSNTTWETLPDYANFATFDLYSRCGASPKYDAADKQQAVRKAFEAIGYGTTNANRTCP